VVGPLLKARKAIEPADRRSRSQGSEAGTL
jgi:hypothetical protein